MSTATFTLTMTFTTVDCPNCGLTFAITKDFENRRRDDHRTFYCPMGHSMSYNGPSEAERRAQQAEKEAERLRRSVENERARVEYWQAEHKATKSQLTATKGQLTKTKKRAANGVCPCCDRSFTNVARHMATQHPDYAESDAGA